MGAHEKITIEVKSDMAAAMRRSLEDGAYQSESALIDEARRDWASVQPADENELRRLRRFIDEGDESGPGIPADEVYAELEAIIASYELDR